MLFAERIKELREKKRISQKQLADYLHISQSSISEYESGNQQPPLTTLIQIADYFDVNIDYLLGRTNIAVSMNKLREKISTRSGEIPINDLFTLKSNEKEIIGLLIQSFSEYSKK